ncbi:MAG: hypothetical protein JWQ04_3588, partial [Pedosphaera sp.]|nr:hypothetical protein [Pedosphaera sp.]
MLDAVQELWALHAWQYSAVNPEAGIPARYWPDAIKALNPIEVYSDAGNIAVVQKNVAGVEFGKYIIYFASSKGIPFGEDSFAVTPIPGMPCVYDYTKIPPKTKTDAIPGSPKPPYPPSSVLKSVTWHWETYTTAA